MEGPALPRLGGAPLPPLGEALMEPSADTLVLMEGDQDRDRRCSLEWVRDRETLWRDRELDLLLSHDRDLDRDFL